MNINDIIPFTDDAALLVTCIKMQLAKGLGDDIAMHRGFELACCRPFDATLQNDVDHVAAAWNIIRK